MRILAVFLGLSAGLAAVLMISHATGLDLAWLWYRARFELSPESGAQLSQSDPVVGWSPVPGATVQRSSPDFDVTYTIDGVGARLVPGADAVANRPLAVILGGSFTFGHGVEDSEPYPAVLQRLWPDMELRNRAANGWGPGQVMLSLKRDLAESDRVRLGVYGWLPFHNLRAYRRHSWLSELDEGLGLPQFELVRGRPRLTGLAGRDDTVPDEEPGLRETEREITEALISEMARLSREADARFVMVLLPHRPQEAPSPEIAENMRRYLAATGIPHLDLLSEPELLDPSLYLPNDGHPTPEWHARIAAVTASRPASDGLPVHP